MGSAPVPTHVAPPPVAQPMPMMGEIAPPPVEPEPLMGKPAAPPEAEEAVKKGAKRGHQKEPPHLMGRVGRPAPLMGDVDVSLFRE
jgi:hypothetical protein